MPHYYSCKICGRFFESEVEYEYCPQCKTADDEMYNSVRNYLIEKPRASIFDVTSELKIPVKVIKRFLREDRLEIVESNNSFLKCESCGKSIKSGYFCNDCRSGRRTRNYESDASSNENSNGSESLGLTNEKKLRYL